MPRPLTAKAAAFERLAMSTGTIDALDRSARALRAAAEDRGWEEWVRAHRRISPADLAALRRLWDAAEPLDMDDLDLEVALDRAVERDRRLRGGAAGRRRARGLELGDSDASDATTASVGSCV